MDFKTASDALFERIPHGTLAEELGVSVAAIRQARLNVSAKAHRPPPKNWEQAIVGMVENRIQSFHELIGEITKSQHGNSAESRNGEPL